MSYTATYIVEGYSITFSDLGILIDPNTTDLDDAAYLSALKAAFAIYDEINNLGFLRDWGNMNLSSDTDAWIDELYQSAEQAEKQQVVPLDDFEISAISKIRAEKERRELKLSRDVGKPSKPKPGYVYLIQSENGQYKIGKSNNPSQRCKIFGLKLPFKVELIHLVKTDDMSKLETELHKHFASQRINGEWFSLSPEDIDYIKSFGGEA